MTTQHSQLYARAPRRLVTTGKLFCASLLVLTAASQCVADSFDRMQQRQLNRSRSQLEEQVRNLGESRSFTWDSCTKLGVVIIPKNDQPYDVRLKIGRLYPYQLKEGDVGDLSHLRLLTVERILSGTNMVLTSGEKQVTRFCLVQYPTEGLVDNERVILWGPVSVSGTTKYIDEAGLPVTLRNVRFLSVEEIEKMRNAQDVVRAYP